MEGLLESSSNIEENIDKDNACVVKSLLVVWILNITYPFPCHKAENIADSYNILKCYRHL